MLHIMSRISRGRTPKFPRLGKATSEIESFLGVPGSMMKVLMESVYLISSWFVVGYAETILCGWCGSLLGLVRMANDAYCGLRKTRRYFLVVNWRRGGGRCEPI